MRIAILGYGKMGKAIEKIAIDRGHTIGFKTSTSIANETLENIDVAIDFSIPDAAFDNISSCIKQNIPIISGTTGWLDKYEETVELCVELNGTFLYASNFSLGVNIFFEVNKTLANLMRDFSQYKVSIEEIHHTQKLDAPSGTAISLANDIIANSEYSNWTMDSPKTDDIRVEAKRIENVPGTHEIVYASEVDNLSIKHVAHSRQGFALGAVIAAEWIFGKTGVFTMKDVLNLS